MQHDAHDQILHQFAGLDLGEVVIDPSGVAVHHLLDVRIPVRLAGTPQQAAVRWTEAHPPHPRRLIAGNETGATLIVEACTVVDGGMSARAVTTTALVRAGTEVAVDVEPLGARWWDEGPPLHAGTLPPVAAALMWQATRGEGGAAASARTLLWSLGEDDGATRIPAPAGAVGWVLVDGDVVLAAFVSGARSPGRRLHGMSEDDAGEGGPRTALGEAIRDGLVRRRLVARAVLGAAGRRDLVVLPRGLELVDRVAAAESRHAA